MAEATLGRLVAAETTLIHALDGDDVGLVEAAMADLGECVTAVRAIGGWRATPAIMDHLVEGLALAEAARIRINYLADRNHRRLDLLMATAGAQRPTPAYGRDGRVRA